MFQAYLPLDKIYRDVYIHFFCIIDIYVFYQIQYSDNPLKATLLDYLIFLWLAYTERRKRIYLSSGDSLLTDEFETIRRISQSLEATGLCVKAIVSF